LGSAKSRRLEMAVAAIQKKWGPRALRRVGSEDMAAEIPHIPTGFPALDEALGIGGVPRGRITEILGVPTSGMTTLALKLVAGAQAEGDVAAYLDLSYSLDPDYAVRCGVALSELLLVRPHGGEEALEIAPSLAASGGVGVLVFDSTSDLLAEGGTWPMSSALRRLVSAVRGSPCAMVFLTGLYFGGAESPANYPTGFDLPRCAALRLLLERERWLRRRRDVRGYTTRVTVIKNKFAPIGASATIAITLENDQIPMSQ